MKESARIALSYVRGHAAELGIDEDAFEDREFHVHVPAGAIPKDGPSAGVTMVTALASLLTGRPVKHTVGMTGEVTLQGRVLPIGGLKQKVLAAHAAGLTEVVLPERNRGDLDDVPADVREAMTFHPAMSIDEVLDAALEAAPRWWRSVGSRAMSRILITGAARGIGAEAAPAASPGAGHQLALLGLEPELLEEVAASVRRDRATRSTSPTTRRSTRRSSEAVGRARRPRRRDRQRGHRQRRHRSAAMDPRDVGEGHRRSTSIGVYRTVRAALPHDRRVARLRAAGRVASRRSPTRR